MDETAWQNEHGSNGEAKEVWIVGVDGSACSRHAALWAAAHAPGRARALRLTTAWNIPAMASGMTYAPLMGANEPEVFEQNAREHVERAAAEMAPGLNVAIETVVALGNSSSVLLEAASHGSLLVLGARGRGGFSRLLLGSTSLQCATHATTTTVVVPAGSAITSSSNIMVGVDGSENSLAALQWAVEFAPQDATLEAISVWDVSPISVGADQFFFPEASELARERFDHKITETLAELGRGDLTVHQQFVEGRPREILNEHADRADLVVMGTRSHGAIGSAILGSVSTWMLHHLRTPMVVVPNGQAERPVD